MHRDKQVQSLSLYQLLGGEQVVRQIVDRFYDLMELEEAFHDIRKLHPQDLSHSRQKLFFFLSGWLNGPTLYEQHYGAPRLRMRHFPFAIGLRERDQWIACMDKAMKQCGIGEIYRLQLNQSFFQIADWMRNQPEQDN